MYKSTMENTLVLQNNYASHTDYVAAEDLKRLSFITGIIKQHCQPGSHILDLGCGNGNISLALGALGYQVTGADIDPGSIARANARNTFPNVSFKVASAEELRADRQVDAVVCSEVLEHLDDPAALLKKISALLSPGKLLVVTVPNGYGPRESLITKPVIQLHRMGYGPLLARIKKQLGYSSKTVQSSNPDLTHVQFFTRSKLEGMIRSQGYKRIAFRNADFIEKVFPFSLFANRFHILQRWDCGLADYLPSFLSSGFYTAWEKE